MSRDKDEKLSKIYNQRVLSFLPFHAAEQRRKRGNRARTISEQLQVASFAAP